MGPSEPRATLRAAIDEVASRDPVLAELVARVGPITHRPRDPDGPFGALVRAIVFQQLAGRAAQAIYGRLQATVGDTLTPETLTAASDAALRAAGLSANKLASLRDLSTKVLDGTLALTRTSRRSDVELIAALVTVRGIGRWTAEMYLMFQLRRLDVWPVDDLGVRQGYGLAWKLEPTPSAKQLEPLGDRFKPYRSLRALSPGRFRLEGGRERVEGLRVARSGHPDSVEVCRSLTLGRERRGAELVRRVDHDLAGERPRLLERPRQHAPGNGDHDDLAEAGGLGGRAHPGG